MTKKKASLCVLCSNWSHNECAKGHSPNNYKAINGPKRVCSDYSIPVVPRPNFFQTIFHTLFGAK